MANVLAMQGHYQEAHKTFSEVLEIQKKNKDPNRLLTWGLIADMFRNQEKYKEALEIYENILYEQTENLGPDHLHTLNTCTDLSHVLSSLVKLDEALQVLQKSLVIQKNKFGPEHTRTLITELNIAIVLRGLGKYEEELNIYYKKIKRISKEPSIILEVQKSIAETQEKQGMFEEALNILTEVLEMQKCIHNNLDTLDTLEGIANINIALGKYNTGLEILNKIYTNYENTLSSENPKTLGINNSMAEVLLKMHKFDEALQIFTKNYNVMKRPDFFCPDHPEILIAYNNMAGILSGQGKYEESLGMMKEVHEKYKNILPSNNPDMLPM